MAPGASPNFHALPFIFVVMICCKKNKSFAWGWVFVKKFHYFLFSPNLPPTIIWRPGHAPPPPVVTPLIARCLQPPTRTMTPLNFGRNWIIINFRKYFQLKTFNFKSKPQSSRLSGYFHQKLTFHVFLKVLKVCSASQLNENFIAQCIYTRRDIYYCLLLGYIIAYLQTTKYLNKIFSSCSKMTIDYTIRKMK